MRGAPYTTADRRWGWRGGENGLLLLDPRVLSGKTELSERVHKKRNKAEIAPKAGGMFRLRTRSASGASLCLTPHASSTPQKKTWSRNFSPAAIHTSPEATTNENAAHPAERHQTAATDTASPALPPTDFQVPPGPRRRLRQLAHTPAPTAAATWPASSSFLRPLPKRCRYGTAGRYVCQRGVRG